MKGKLILIPTPIDDQSALESKAFHLLNTATELDSIILVEEAKTGRRRWLHWGLPRERIEHFVLYNEHNQAESAQAFIKELKNGKTIFLMSDCGLPAFCDPGQKLVNLCHQNKIQVTATPFPNSISLAVALSGFPHDRFMFEGFLPVENQPREEALKVILKKPYTTILMDTPYRLEKLLTELAKMSSDLKLKREIFLGLDLNQETEELFRGYPQEILEKIANKKREFVLLLAPL